MSSDHSPIPLLVSTFIRIVGEEAAGKLVSAFGDSELSIPAHATADHKITDVIGLEAFTKLCDHYRQSTAGNDTGIKLFVPKWTSRDACATWLNVLKAGGTAYEIARAMNVTQRTVRRWRKRLKADLGTDQPSSSR